MMRSLETLLPLVFLSAALGVYAVYLIPAQPVYYIRY
jgi:hypothetical protein